MRVKDEQIEQLHEIIKNLTIGQLLVRVKRGMKSRNRMLRHSGSDILGLSMLFLDFL